MKPVQKVELGGQAFEVLKAEHDNMFFYQNATRQARTLYLSPDGLDLNKVRELFKDPKNTRLLKATALVYDQAGKASDSEFTEELQDFILLSSFRVEAVPLYTLEAGGGHASSEAPAGEKELLVIQLCQQSFAEKQQEKIIAFAKAMGIDL